MNTELHKRLEEAADIHCKCDTCILEHKATGGCLKKVCSIHNAYLEGAEYGYKEAIALAKKWLEMESARNGKMVVVDEDLLADFESDMNKLWEEQE